MTRAERMLRWDEAAALGMSYCDAGEHLCNTDDMLAAPEGEEPLRCFRHLEIDMKWDE